MEPTVMAIVTEVHLPQPPQQRQEEKVEVEDMDMTVTAIVAAVHLPQPQQLQEQVNMEAEVEEEHLDLMVTVTMMTVQQLGPPHQPQQQVQLEVVEVEDI